jgi:signal transduction histidine kinase
MDHDIPFARLRFFRHELGVTQAVAAALAPHHQTFIAHRAEMAADLYARIAKIALTKIVLEHETSPARLQGNWQRWYTALWQDPLGDGLLSAVWKSGQAHVSHGVDHRFITLAYSHARLYTQALIERLVSGPERDVVHDAADRLIDLCTLIETDAYIAASAQCSLEVMMGIAHQMRNPLTVIGGFARRMLESARPGCPDGVGPETIMDEAKRMERMVKDVGVYVGVLRAEPSFSPEPLAAAVDRVLARLAGEGWPGPVTLAVDLPPGAAVQADRGMLDEMLCQVLTNAFEAAAGTPPTVDVGTVPGPEGFVALAVANSGRPPRAEDIPGYFQPFASSKPMGTGFGLAIALLAARKCFGTVGLEPTGTGARSLITLPKSGMVHPSGLFPAA